MKFIFNIYQNVYNSIQKAEVEMLRIAVKSRQNDLVTKMLGSKSATQKQAPNSNGGGTDVTDSVTPIYSDELFQVLMVK